VLVLENELIASHYFCFQNPTILLKDWNNSFPPHFFTNKTMRQSNTYRKHRQKRFPTIVCNKTAGNVVT
jgi:hypothetical protein